MKRVFFGIVALSLLVAGCASARHTKVGKIKRAIRAIEVTKANLKTAPCTQLDGAMATSYGYARAFNDPNVLRKRNLHTKSANIKFRAYYQDFASEYRARCPGKPVKTIAMKKLYPDIVKAAKEKAKKKQQARY